jgi:hydroxymethylbilane synthase
MVPNAELRRRNSSGSRSITNKVTSFGKRIFKIGTRSSPLALKQVQEVIELLRRFYPAIKVEIIGIDTCGDKDKTTPISEIEGSDFFTREIDEALLKGEIDFAVHSAKDLPESLREELVIAAITSSIDPYDVLVSKSGLKLDRLPYGAKIGTSSLRRRQQLKKYREDFKIVDIRGNIGERLNILDISDLDGIVIAAAGLIRLGLEDRIIQRIPFNILKPHPLQGCLAIEVRKNDRETIDLFAPIKQ